MTIELAVGRLLVATPALLDPNFFRSVVLLLAHGDEGTLGVVLNRPAQVPVLDVLPGYAELASRPASVFVGGPVSPSSALCLAALRPESDPSGWTQVSGRTGLLDTDLAPDALTGRIDRLRVFSGYTGWGPGQLAGELAAGAWYVLEAEPADPYSPDPGELWKRVLRRQGFELAIVATCPPDPNLN